LHAQSLPLSEIWVNKIVQGKVINHSVSWLNANVIKLRARSPVPWMQFTKRCPQVVELGHGCVGGVASRGRASIPMWKSLCITGLYIKRCFAVSWLRRLVLSCSSRRPGFITWTAVVRHVVGRTTPRQVLVFLPVLRSSFVSIIPPMLHTHLRVHVAVTRRTNGRRMGTFRKTMTFRNSENTLYTSMFTNFRLRSKM
jgi:hypothetical protein